MNFYAIAYSIESICPKRLDWLVRYGYTREKNHVGESLN
jgi:hypothetical protein